MSKAALLREMIQSIIESDEQHRYVNAIYCDMDGVLVDFEQGAIKLVSDILNNNADPSWTRDKNINNIINLRLELGDAWRPERREDLDKKLVRKIMLSSISSNPGLFFQNLPPLRDGVSELWPFLNSLGVPVHILSAPIRGNGMTADEGKTNWIIEHLNPQPESIIIVDAVNKQNYATNNDNPNLLVDDKESTIITWNERNGVGILHEPGNSQNSIEKIKLRISP